jgi:hypothetical protein
MGILNGSDDVLRIEEGRKDANGEQRSGPLFSFVQQGPR